MTDLSQFAEMPDRMIAITYRFKITDTSVFLEELPEIGAPKKFPPVSVGVITQILEKEDKGGNRVATVTVTQAKP